MSAIVCPLPPKKALFTIEGQSASGGVSDTGFEQVVVGSSGRIRAQLSFDIVPTNEALWQRRLLLGRRLVAHLKGRANTILVGPTDARFTSPAALLGEPTGPFDQPHDDGTLFDDGTGYDHSATLAQALSADMGLASLMVHMLSAHTPRPGQWFGLKGKELYLIDTVARYIDAPSPDFYTLTFIPTLRSAVVDGEDLDFEAPVCEMRSAADRPLDLSLERLFRGEATLDLVEACP